MGGGYLDLDRRMRRRAGRAAASGEGGGITAGRLAVAVAGRGRKVGSVWGSEDEVAAVSLYDFSSPFFFVFVFLFGRKPEGGSGPCWDSADLVCGPAPATAKLREPKLQSAGPFSLSPLRTSPGHQFGLFFFFFIFRFAFPCIFPS